MIGDLHLANRNPLLSKLRPDTIFNNKGSINKKAQLELELHSFKQWNFKKEHIKSTELVIKMN